MKEIGSGVVASRPDQMYGWPGMTRAANGDILVVASERKHHVCPFGRPVVMRSRDNGLTWSLPQEIYNSELDDRDSTIACLPDGTLVAAWFTSAEFGDPQYARAEWRPRFGRVTEKMREELTGDWLIRSTDHGRTWEPTPHRMPVGGAEHIGPFVLSDGRLACFGYELVDTEADMFFFTSMDQGDTWIRQGKIASEKMHKHPMDAFWPLCRGRKLPFPHVNERALLELGPGRFLVLFRNSREGKLTEARSEDNGRTWSHLKVTPIIGKPPHLLRLRNGAILCSYGHRAEPWSIRAVLSYDEGKTWDMENLITIDGWEDHPDMGYPISLETAPGEILTVYYCSRQPIKHAPKDEATYKRGSSPEGILFKRFRLMDRKE